MVSSGLILVSWGMWHIQRRGDVHTGCWWGNLMEINHLDDLDTGGKIILKWI